MFLKIFVIHEVVIYSLYLNIILNAANTYEQGT